MKTTLFNFSKVISTVKYVGAVAVFVTGLAAFSGCAKKGCTDTTADNYDADATEDDGSCIDAADKFVGTYKYNEPTGTGCGVSDYTVTVTKSSTAGNKIIINGFGGFACNGGSNITVEATVDGQDITISQQSFCSSAIEITSGTGTMNSSNNSFSVDYSYVLSGNSAVSCGGTYQKQ